jgi:hypothetical protein
MNKMLAVRMLALTSFSAPSAPKGKCAMPTMLSGPPRHTSTSTPEETKLSGNPP